MGVSERRQREREARRQRIIDAAERVFFAGGYDQATMDDIASAVELSKGALYLYFKSKDELYAALVNRCHASLIDDLEADSRREQSGLELVAAIARTYVQFVRDYPQHTRLMLSAMATGQFGPTELNESGEHHELAMREMKLVLEAVERGRRDGSIRPEVEASELSAHLWGGLMGMMMLELNDEHFSREWPGAFNLTAAVPSFIDLLMRGIATGEGSAVPMPGVA